MLIDAWALINKKCPDWMLNIYGQGEWKEMLVEKIAALNLQEVVVLHGVSMKIADEYKRSSFYVMSSRFEGLPMVLIEAMSFGLPVISFDCEFGPSEIVTDGVDGYLVEPNNIEELANRICFLIENEDKRKLMGQQAIINVRRFDKETVMQQWLNLFDSLMMS
jgi:glycosyltransferase involved in cell wall biosynthesis